MFYTRGFIVELHLIIQILNNNNQRCLDSEKARKPVEKMDSDPK